MTVRVAINGFGRIGRLVLRALCETRCDRAVILKTVVDTEVHLHRAHHALVDAGRCTRDASNAIPDGGMRFGSECKETAARASALARRLGTPVPISARPPQFSCEVEGARMRLDRIERLAEVNRINAYRAAAGLVPLQ